MIPTRLQKTNEQYAIKAKSLCSQAARAYGHTSPFTVPPLAVVEHLIGRKGSIARNTWKQYKNALRCHFQTLLTDSPEKAIQEEIQAAIQLLSASTSEGTLRHGLQTSARKQKGFKRADFDRVMAYLQDQLGKQKYARALMTWLRASRLVGLRPGEWENASVDSRSAPPTLSVKNAKATNGRGNGESRTLDLKNLSTEELDSITEMLSMLEGYQVDTTFEHLQARLGDYMRYVTRQCLGRRQKYPTLYSLRHQFSANAKFSGMTRAEVAALMGHGSDDTAGEHYARRTSGDSAVKVTPVVSEVHNVRAKAKRFIHKAKPKGQ